MNFLNGMKSNIGIAVIILANIASFFGYDVQPDTTDVITSSVTDIADGIGKFILAVGVIHKLKKAEK